MFGEKSEEITSEIIERNIGISKDFNNFELNNALAKKDILKSACKDLQLQSLSIRRN